MTLHERKEVEDFMLKSLFFAALTVTFVAGISYADQSSSVVVVPVNKTPASSGKQMYTSYCAPCHGTDGRGNGPAAKALKSAPTDLSSLAKAHGGKYPTEHVTAVLEFGAENSPAHGSVEMPVWGPMLGKMDDKNGQSEMRMLRISNLNHYIESMQVK
jgi:mono/diheme cytochrome c family protein